MEAKVKRDLRRAKSVIATLPDWQRFGVVFAIETACEDPKAAWEALKRAGRYPTGGTRYKLHRRVMAWFDRAANPPPPLNRSQ